MPGSSIGPTFVHSLWYLYFTKLGDRRILFSGSGTVYTSGSPWRIFCYNFTSTIVGGQVCFMQWHPILDKFTFESISIHDGWYHDSFHLACSIVDVLHITSKDIMWFVLLRLSLLYVLLRNMCHKFLSKWCMNSVHMSVYVYLALLAPLKYLIVSFLYFSYN